MFYDLSQPHSTDSGMNLPMLLQSKFIQLENRALKSPRFQLGTTKTKPSEASPPTMNSASIENSPDVLNEKYADRLSYLGSEFNSATIARRNLGKLESAERTTQSTRRQRPERNEFERNSASSVR